MTTSREDKLALQLAELRVEAAYGFLPLARVMKERPRQHCRVALLGCTAQKAAWREPAAFLYSRSPFFRKALEYAARTCDAALVLSAKHGVLELHEEVEPYDLALADVTGQAYRDWTARVDARLAELLPQGYVAELVVLCGERYVFKLARPEAWVWRETLVKHVKGRTLGLGIGERSAWLDEQLRHKLPPRHAHGEACHWGTLCRVPSEALWGVKGGTP